MYRVKLGAGTAYSEVIALDRDGFVEGVVYTSTLANCLAYVNLMERGILILP